MVVVDDLVNQKIDQVIWQPKARLGLLLLRHLLLLLGHFVKKVEDKDDVFLADQN